jgi:BlaI family transcriptional regulator, penicillinase repressor
MAKRPLLSRGEIEIVQAVWNLERASVGEVYQHLARSKTIDYATVQTYLRRLEQKGYVRTRRVGRNKLYCPRVSRRRVVGQLIDDFLNQLFDGQALVLMQHLIQDRGITPTEIAKLRRTLDHLEQRHAKDDRGDDHDDS